MKPYALLFRFVESRHFASLLLLLVLLTQVPTALKNDMRGDDFLQWAVFTNNSLLSSRGLIPNPGDSGLWTTISNQFHFFSPENNFLASLKDYGVLPWWTGNDAHLHLLRPVASLSHWLDYQLGLSPKAMLGVNLLVYLAVLYLLFRLYRHLGYPRALINLALLFFAIDYSLQGSLEWIASRNTLIALAFSILSLHFFIHWRTLRQSRDCILSLICLLASVLSAEAGIATIAYLFSYVMLVEKNSLQRKIMVLLPSAVLIVIWRICYQLAGYGAKNIDHYLDPVRDPGLFLGKVITGVPVILGEQISGVDAVDRMLSPDTLIQVSLLSLGLVTLAVLVLLPLIRHSALTRFWLLGALIATIPMCAIQHTDPRTMAFIALAFFPVCAEFVCFTRSRLNSAGTLEKITGWLGRSWILIVYLLIPLTVFATLHTQFLLAWKNNQTRAHISDLYVVGDGKSLQDKQVIVLAAPSPMLFMYASYRMAYYDAAIPESIHVIAPAFSDITITRMDARRLKIRPETGFLLSKFDLLPGDEQHPIHTAKYGRNMMGFLTRNPSFEKGPVFSNGRLAIDVTEVKKGRAMEIDLSMKDVLESQDYVFVYWDWRSNAYQPFTLPDIGESFTIPGPFFD